MDPNSVIKEMQVLFDEIFLDQVVLTPELSAKQVPEWDSLMHINILVAVEEHFHIRFRVGEVEATRNVGEFAELVGRRILEGN
jgi:acyl carrier protein